MSQEQSYHPNLHRFSCNVIATPSLNKSQILKILSEELSMQQEEIEEMYIVIDYVDVQSMRLR